MNKIVSTAFLGLALAVGSATAQVYVKVAPPPVRKEVISVRPGPRYVWVRGFYRWDGRRYVWVPGRWIVPPRSNVVWVDGRWVHHQGGWVWIDGHW